MNAIQDPNLLVDTKLLFTGTGENRGNNLAWPFSQLLQINSF